MKTKVSNDSTTTGTVGVISWHYTDGDDGTDYLAQNQTKVETFTVHLNDGTSLFARGRRHTSYIGDWSSDVCSSDLDSASGAVSEDVAADGSNNLNASGTLSFSDVD